MLKNGGEKIHVCRISAFGLLTNLAHHKDFIAEAGEIENVDEKNTLPRSFFPNRYLSG